MVPCLIVAASWRSGVQLYRTAHPHLTTLWRDGVRCSCNGGRTTDTEFRIWVFRDAIVCPTATSRTRRLNGSELKW